MITQSRRLGLTTVPEDDSKITGLFSFAQWAPTSLFYATAVTTIGTFVYLGHLTDTWVYAMAVTSTNIFLFYVIKLGFGGPAIRGMMVPILPGSRTCRQMPVWGGAHHGRLAGGVFPARRLGGVRAPAAFRLRRSSRPPAGVRRRAVP